MPQFTQPQIAQLSPPQVTKVQDLEKKLGDVVIIAYQQQIVPAQLTPQQVQALQQAEQDLGTCLVAYRRA